MADVPALPVDLIVSADPVDTVSPLLITIRDLGVWARQTIAEDDQFANEICYAASEKVRATARQPNWDVTTAPARARQICAHLASRSYLNPDSISSEGNLGPLGGDRTVEELAKALHLTGAEIAELEGMSPAASSGEGGLWVQPINSTPYDGGDVFLRDDSGSDWMIPYLAEDDLPALG